jgi:hypothetical protein
LKRRTVRIKEEGGKIWEMVNFQRWEGVENDALLELRKEGELFSSLNILLYGM